LLLRCFHSTGDIVSHPLESLSPRETQTPLCQICHKETSPPNTRRTMNHDMVPCLSVGNRVLDCLFQVVFGRHTKIRNGQIQYLESLFEVPRSQIASCPVETFCVARKEDNDRNLFLTKSVIRLAMEIIGAERHGTPKDTTRETKGEFGQRHECSS
jgi:hypothetical protein